jgi:metallo-beta-lactamase family protein
MNVELQFLGAAGTVTGSRFLLRVNGRTYLVDCGLFQGGRQLKALNWEPFPVPPEQIEAVLLTHAHIDHTGYLPRLVQQGFRGPVYATEATCALLDILLPDSAYLREQDAAYANKKGYGRHKPALPLYTTADAEQALHRLQPVRFHHSLALAGGVTTTWRPAGHLLGSAIGIAYFLCCPQRQSEFERKPKTYARPEVGEKVKKGKRRQHRQPQ